MRPPIPPFDPLGMPLPAFVLQALAYLTFTLHLLAVQFTVGGAILLLVNWLRGRRSGDASAVATARFFGTSLPLGFSYLVTFGIPPLLFVQVMYGQFFYSSSVLVGAFWISVVRLLIMGYGASYWHKLSRGERPGRQVGIIGLSLLALLCVGFIYVNNLTLSMVPERWMPLYQSHPAGGTLNLGEPTLLSRYLLVLGPGLAVAGLALVTRAVLLRRWGKPDLAATAHRSGVRAMLVAAVVEVVAVIGMAVTLPENVRAVLTSGGVLTMLAVLGGVLGVAALALASVSGKRVGLVLPLLAGASQLGATAAWVVLRDFVRQEYLRPYFDLGAVTVHAQWGMFALFTSTLVMGVAFMVVSTMKTVTALAVQREKMDGASGKQVAG